MLYMVDALRYGFLGTSDINVWEVDPLFSSDYLSLYRHSASHSEDRLEAENLNPLT